MQDDARDAMRGVPPLTLPCRTSARGRGGRHVPRRKLPEYDYDQLRMLEAME